MYPGPICISVLPTMPTVLPIPTTLATAERGNISDTIVNRLADHPWCAAVASPTSPTTTHKLLQYGAHTTGATHNAHTSMVVLRAEFTVHPRLMRLPESHPPPMLPTLQMLKTTSVRSTICFSDRAKRSEEHT